MAQTRESRRRPPTHTAQAAKQIGSHYLVPLIAGLAVGGLWLLNRDKSLLYHAVQMTALMSVLTVVQVVLDRRGGRAPASPGAYARLFGRLLGSKLVLVAVAVGAEWLLAPRTSRSNAIVAAGLVVWVTALGPVLDRLATNQAKPATGPDQAHLASPSMGISAAPSTPGDVPPGPPSPNGRTHDRHHARWTP
jgi:hypothetical protein